MPGNMVVMIGLQGSGKSTSYEKYLAAEYVRVNLDTLKTRHRESILLEECLVQGKNFAVDNTNPTRADRARYIPPAREKGYRIIGYFMAAGVRECIGRNSLRTGKARVPDIAIAATAKKLEIPSFDEGFDELYAVKNDGTTMTVHPWMPLPESGSFSPEESLP